MIAPRQFGARYQCVYGGRAVDADFGEVVVRYGRVDEAGILAAIAHDLARFKLPKRAALVEALPRNTMGKVQKKVLRESYAGVMG